MRLVLFLAHVCSAYEPATLLRAADVRPIAEADLESGYADDYPHRALVLAEAIDENSAEAIPVLIPETSRMPSMWSSEWDIFDISTEASRFRLSKYVAYSLLAVYATIVLILLGIKGL